MAKAEIPCFTKGKNQLSAADIERTREVANVRIHVERVIGVVRQKYTILGGTISLNYMNTTDGNNLTMMDKAAHVCCALSTGVIHS